MPLTPDRVRIMQGRVNEKLTMRFTLQRDVNVGTEVAPGHRAAPNWQTVGVDLPCYAWNLVRVVQGVYGFPERERIMGDWRMFVMADLDVREKDVVIDIGVDMRVGLIGDIERYIITPGPLGIQFVGGHSGYQLLMLDEVR